MIHPASLPLSIAHDSIIAFCHADQLQLSNYGWNLKLWLGLFYTLMEQRPVEPDENSVPVAWRLN